MSYNEISAGESTDDLGSNRGHWGPNPQVPLSHWTHYRHELPHSGVETGLNSPCAINLVLCVFAVDKAAV